SQIVAFNTTGRAVRLPVSLLESAADGRLMRLNADDRIIAAFAIEPSAQFLLGGADGTIQLVRAASIPLVTDLNTPGTSIYPRRDLRSVVLWRANDVLWIATSQRVRRHDAPGIPTGKLKLGKGETLVCLVTR
ncbi:MAG: hypothetical protein LC121_18120, partial [Anaerolineae bacterium]|nr:hypothetical protein [Anaerolineae bacterium]